MLLRLAVLALLVAPSLALAGEVDAKVVLVEQTKDGVCVTVKEARGERTARFLLKDAGGKLMPKVGAAAVVDFEKGRAGFPDRAERYELVAQPSVTLSAKDHTAIIRALMEHAVDLKKALGGSRVGGTQVLQAAANLKGIDAGTRQKIRIVLEQLPTVEKRAASLPSDKRAALARIVDGLAGARSAQDQIKRLAAMKERFAAQADVAGAIDFATGLLQDGAASIYTPDAAYYALPDLFDEETEAAAEAVKVGLADAAGAIEGFLAGTPFGFLSAGSDAATKASAASANAIAEQLSQKAAKKPPQK